MANKYKVTYSDWLTTTIEADEFFVTQGDLYLRNIVGNYATGYPKYEEVASFSNNNWRNVIKEVSSGS